jgi:hypothetical protein
MQNIVPNAHSTMEPIDTPEQTDSFPCAHERHVRASQGCSAQQPRRHWPQRARGRREAIITDRHADVFSDRERAACRRRRRRRVHGRESDEERLRPRARGVGAGDCAAVDAPSLSDRTTACVGRLQRKRRNERPTYRAHRQTGLTGAKKMRRRIALLAIHTAVLCRLSNSELGSLVTSAHAVWWVAPV